MVRILFLVVLVSVTGCGTITCLDVAQNDPKCQPIYGGVRTDINCILTGSEEWEKLKVGESKYLVKPFCVIDLPFSLVADTLLLPRAISLTIENKKLREKEQQEGGTIEEVKEN